MELQKFPFSRQSTISEAELSCINEIETRQMRIGAVHCISTLTGAGNVAVKLCAEPGLTESKL